MKALNHFNILKYSKRPFSDIEEMNNVIIDSVHSMIKPGSVFYFLGDLAFDKKTGQRFLESLDDRIEFHFIRGNHDKAFQDSYLSRYCASISRIKDININGQKITLCHYPMQSFNCSHFGAWQLYGHHHRDTSDIVPGKKMNIGVDVNNFVPVSFERVKEYMGKREDNWDMINKPT